MRVLRRDKTVAGAKHLLMPGTVADHGHATQNFAVFFFVVSIRSPFSSLISTMLEMCAMFVLRQCVLARWRNADETSATS